MHLSIYATSWSAVDSTARQSLRKVQAVRISALGAAMGSAEMGAVRT